MYNCYFLWQERIPFKVWTHDWTVSKGMIVKGEEDLWNKVIEKGNEVLRIQAVSIVSAVDGLPLNDNVFLEMEKGQDLILLEEGQKWTPKVLPKQNSQEIDPENAVQENNALDSESFDGLENDSGNDGVIEETTKKCTHLECESI